jgi:hypothetical protein
MHPWSQTQIKFNISNNKVEKIRNKRYTEEQKFKMLRDKLKEEIYYKKQRIKIQSMNNLERTENTAHTKIRENILNE